MLKRKVIIQPLKHQVKPIFQFFLKKMKKKHLYCSNVDQIGKNLTNLSYFLLDDTALKNILQQDTRIKSLYALLCQA